MCCLVKCCNCGNKQRDSLHDEGDTIFCSKCHHRTKKSNGKDDSIVWPICNHPRDRKAAHCRFCNGSQKGKYSYAEEKSAREFLKQIDADNLTYGKYKNYEPQKSSGLFSYLLDKILEWLNK